MRLVLRGLDEDQALRPAPALSLYERHRFRVHSSSSEWHKPLENA